MTPNPNSPQFIRHEVPDHACENSKKLSQLFHMLKIQVSMGKWNGISEPDVSLTYNTYIRSTEVSVVLHDSNHHSHYFTMQLVPDNGFGDTDEDSFGLIYLFDGKLDENVIIVRSFAEYLIKYLHFEGFEATLIKCDKGISIDCSIQYAYEDFSRLIDITISHLKPLKWFYSIEPTINSFEEAYYYMANVKSKLQIECVKGRWHNVKPECFKLCKFEADGEIALELTYIVEGIWEISLSLDIFDCGGYFDMFSSVNCYLNETLSNGVKTQLDALFADFLTTIKCAKGNVYVGTGYRKDHSISIQYFYFDDSFEIMSEMLDEIIPALHNFNFQLPLQPFNLTGEIEAIKGQMEVALKTIFEVETVEKQINIKLKCGHFRT